MVVDAKLMTLTITADAAAYVVAIPPQNTANITIADNDATATPLPLSGDGGGGGRIEFVSFLLLGVARLLRAAGSRNCSRVPMRPIDARLAPRQFRRASHAAVRIVSVAASGVIRLTSIRRRSTVRRSKNRTSQQEQDGYGSGGDPKWSVVSSASRVRAHAVISLCCLHCSESESRWRRPETLIPASVKTDSGL